MDIQTKTMDENSFTTSIPSNLKEKHVHRDAKEKKGKSSYESKLLYLFYFKLAKLNLKLIRIKLIAISGHWYDLQNMDSEVLAALLSFVGLTFLIYLFIFPKKVIENILP